MSHRRTTFASPACLILLVLLCVGLAAAAWAAVSLPRQAELVFGPPAASLSPVQRIAYSLQLLLHANDLTSPSRPAGAPGKFTVKLGETANSIAVRLSAGGFISDPDTFCMYLVYSGIDTRIQAGEYQLDPGMSAIEIARSLQDATPKDVTFGVLPGWRAEEIAAGLPTSGLRVSQQEFLDVVANL